MESDETTRDASDTDDAAAARPRTRAARLAARVGALSVAAGFLIFTVVRASSSGCAATTADAEAEAPETPAVQGKNDEEPSKQGKGGDPEKQFFPGTKAPSKMHGKP